MMATISAIECRPSLSRRLAAMGLKPGTEVKLLRKALGGDPIMIDLLGHPIALRRADAAQILIESTDAPA